MIPTNDVEPDTLPTVAEFYDGLAPDYDTMTGFQKRFVHEKPFFRLLVEKYKIRSALDAGCGTGFHSLLLAQLGVQVMAIDVSPAMIAEVQKHAHELNLNINAVLSSFSDLNRIEGLRFDAVFAMGNSLAHLLSDEEIRSSLDCFASILNPNGILFMQNLNYDRILARKERIQSIKEVDDKTFIRFYDYTDHLLTFNVLTIARDAGIVRQNLQSVQLRPIRSAELSAMMLSSQFGDIKLLGSIALEDYSPTTSKDLVLLARKKHNEGLR